VIAINNLNFREANMEVMEAIKRRRSIRAFKSTTVDQKTLDIILDAGRLAPSWGNSQTWRWIVIQDSDLKMQLAEKILRQGNRGTEAVKIAPVVIAACAELNKAGCRDGQPSTDKGGYWYMFDAGLALENMVLAAESFGLGSLFIGGMDAKKAESLLGVPSGYACVILMVLGYPDEQPIARPRKEMTDLVFKNTFGSR
jgi:nitroreductase